MYEHGIDQKVISQVLIHFKFSCNFKKYVSDECLLKAGEYIISVHAAHCLESTVTPTKDEMKLMDSDGKLTKHFK